MCFYNEYQLRNSNEKEEKCNHLNVLIFGLRKNVLHKKIEEINVPAVISLFQHPLHNGRMIFGDTLCR